MIRTATAALLALTLMGFAAQAPSDPTPTPEQGVGQPAAAGGIFATHETDSIQGTFWAPAGSPASRPETTLTQRSWSPSAPRRQQLAQR